MPLKDVKATPEELAQVESTRAMYYRDRELFLQREAERMSDIRTWEAPDGAVWVYTVLDGEFVRILGCEQAPAMLVVPSEIEGLPVYELDPDCCSALENVEEVRCPDTIRELGRAAFRRNPNLRRVVLPATMDSFDYTWVRECEKLEEIVLPGQLKRIDASIFDIESLRSLIIGPGACDVVPGAFSKSKLERIAVSEDNPSLSTDGYMLFSKDGTRCIALAVPVESCRLPEGCTTVGKKAFAGHRELVEVEFCETLQTIEPYGFARTGLSKFVAPASLERIEERAFYYCRSLESVQLNEGLRVIDNHAFDGTALTRLEAPASIEQLGERIVADSVLDFSGPDAGFSIAPGAESLFLDKRGGLYRKKDGDVFFVRMLDPRIREYEVLAGTRVISEQAFARHKALRSVVLPDGVEIIDYCAFKKCSALEEVRLPEGLRTIGEEAFLDTSLKSVVLPASLERLGSNALVTNSSNHAGIPPTLRSIEVAEGNERFFVDQGMLCERTSDTSVQVVVFTDSVPRVHIPDNVVRICDYAFNGVKRLRELHLNDGIRSVGTCGLAINAALELLHVDLVRPIDGHSYFDLRFPQTERSAHEISLAFSTSSWINIEKILKHYDNAIVNISDYNARRTTDADVYARANRMLERLLDPVFMTKMHRSVYDNIINMSLERICVAAARNDDRRVIDALMELGYLNKDNLLGIIDEVGKLQDAAMTGYLLELKRRFFRRSAIDFDL